jgi:hypothetical protein
MGWSSGRPLSCVRRGPLRQIDPSQGTRQMNKLAAFVTVALPAVMVAACSQSEPPVAPLPPGPTAEEVTYYAAAQAEYRSAEASGNDDDAEAALYTFTQIPATIILRQDPKLFAAQAACERHRLLGQSGAEPAFEPQFRAACDDVEWRYNEGAIAIRRDLEARTAAADRAVIAQAEPEAR